MPSYISSILITGGTQGMGYQCALCLARRLPTTLIIIASRTDPISAATSINTALNQTNVEYLPLDLGSRASVLDFCQRFKAEHFPTLQAVVFNAAIQLPGNIEFTPDGIEKQFGVNHAGHALLLHWLLSQGDGTIKEDARIVVVGSSVHDPEQGWGMDPEYSTPEEAAVPNNSDSEAEVQRGRKKKNTTGFTRYSTSKLANILWAKALARHLARSTAHARKTVLIVDPGVMFNTGLFRNRSAASRFIMGSLGSSLVPVMKKVWKENIHTPEENGEVLAWLVVSKEVEGENGGYFEGKKRLDVSKLARRESVQEELWRWTVGWVGEDAGAGLG